MKKYIINVFIFSFLNTINSQEKALQLSMQEAIDYAIKTNYDNKIALKDIKIAKEVKRETTTIGLPHINGTVDYQKWLRQQVQLADFDDDGVDEQLIFGKKQSIVAGVTVTQLIFDGTYLVGLQSARAYLKISEQAKEKTELATREAVINAYGNVLIAENALEILENNKKILTKNLNDTQKIFDNGLTEEENVEQLQITLGTLENNIRNTGRLKDIAYQMLNISLGNSIARKLELSDTLESLTIQNTDLELLSKTFDINKHIDYKIANNDREANRLLLKLEKARQLPALSGFINYQYSSFSNEFTFLNNTQKWFGASLLGIRLNVPLFGSFRARSRIKQARITLESSDIRLKEIKQKLNLQAQTAKSEYQLSIENYETAKKNLKLAERIEKKQQMKFFEGISTSFDLSQAQNQLYTQQNNYVESMLNVITKKAQLETALNIPIK